jgi:Spy/CpxP family protein refolding chaperone
LPLHVRRDACAGSTLATYTHEAFRDHVATNTAHVRRRSRTNSRARAQANRATVERVLRLPQSECGIRISGTARKPPFSRRFVLAERLQSLAARSDEIASGSSQEIPMKSLRTKIMIPMFALFASLAACSGQAPNEGSASTANAVGVTAATIENQPHHHAPHMRGPESLLFASLHEDIGLSADQKTKIESALATLKPAGDKPDFAAHQKAVADAIRAGKIDVAALQPPPPDAAQMDAHRAKLAAALDVLHATLTKDQRTALVNAIDKRMESEHGPGKFDGKKFEGKKEGFGPMHLLEGLDLTKDQTDAIHAKLAANAPAPKTDAEKEAMKAKHEEMKKEMEARLQTFVADDFDAKAFVAPPKDAPAMMAHENPMLKDLAVIVPILTPAQREKLATKIEQGPGPKN